MSRRSRTPFLDGLIAAYTTLVGLACIGIGGGLLVESVGLWMRIAVRDWWRNAVYADWLTPWERAVLLSDLVPEQVVFILDRFVTDTPQVAGTTVVLIMLGIVFIAYGRWWGGRSAGGSDR